MAVTMQVNLRELREASRFVNKVVIQSKSAGRELLKEFGTRTKRYIVQNARKRIYPRRNSISENLANSVKKTTHIGAKSAFSEVQVLASYGAMMETGTQPHAEPNHPWFHGRDGGRIHPGAQGYPIQGFVSRGFNKALGEMPKLARSIFDKKLRIIKR